MASRLMKDLEAALSQDPPPEAVKKRKGHRNKDGKEEWYEYLPAAWVEDEMRRIFGLAWHREVVAINSGVDRNPAGEGQAWAWVKVRLTLLIEPVPIIREATGAAAKNKNGYKEVAIANAAKHAETNAFCRAAASLGRRLGGALKLEEDDEPPAADAAAPAAPPKASSTPAPASPVPAKTNDAPARGGPAGGAPPATPPAGASQIPASVGPADLVAVGYPAGMAERICAYATDQVAPKDKLMQLYDQFSPLLGKDAVLGLLKDVGVTRETAAQTFTGMAMRRFAWAAGARVKAKKSTKES